MKSKSNSIKKIALIIPSLEAGGAERVMSMLANNFVTYPDVEVYLILFVKSDLFYELSPKVKVYQPHFDFKNYNRIVYTIKLSQFLRKTIKALAPRVILSFGGRYNSFVILNSLGLKSKCYISDRSSPLRSNGLLLDFLNKLLYPLADGIIAQTSKAKNIFEKKYHLKKIIVIGNPFKNLSNTEISTRKNIIINVGRFIPTKQQPMLVDFFSKVKQEGWELWFLGDGPILDGTKKLVNDLDLVDKVKFFGTVTNVENFLLQSKIFAFTSISEGFPNALGEAMSAGCACISFDCFAGPSDMIQNNKNGVLIEENNLTDYLLQFERLMHNSNAIEQYSIAAKKTISENYNENYISKNYFNFLLSE